MKIFLLFFACLPLLAAEPRPMAAVDLFSIPIARQGTLSPDGETLVFQKSEVNWERNRWVAQLWRKSLASGELRQLTFNHNGSWSPQWSPDGTHLLFLSEREGDDSTQLYLMPTDGGEARRISELKKTPTNIQWSPDGEWLYFLSQNETPKEVRKLIERRKIIPRFEDPHQRKILHRVKVSEGITEQISGPDESIFDYHLNKDGTKLSLLKGKGSLLDDIYQADIWTCNTDGTNGLQITQNEIAERSLTFSPDASHMAYTASVNEEDEGYHKVNLFLVDLASQKRTLLTKDFSGEVRSFAWNQSGDGLFFVGNIGVSNHLFHLQLANGDITQLTSGPWSITEWDYHSEHQAHLLKRTSAIEPGDYWTLTDGDKLKRETHLHREISQTFILPKQELIRWKSHDGVEIEGLLTYPNDFEEGVPFPLVVDTHGGPQKSDQYSIWSSGRYLPVLAAHGYGTLLPNHRGSTGYGDEFMRDMVGNYFKNSHLDVLAGIDHLVAKGLADPDQLIKKGWSAGGHMTNKLITYTDRFKAASSGAGVVDWASQFGETDTFYRRTWWFDGKPWQEDAPTANFTNTSIMKDLWKVKTPTLIFVGEKDVRVPASQSKMLFRGLRDLGVETELYIAPGEPHGFRKPTHRLFRINKELEWFEHYVHGRDYEFSLPEEESE